MVEQNLNFIENTYRNYSKVSATIFFDFSLSAATTFRGRLCLGGDYLYQILKQTFGKIHFWQNTLLANLKSLVRFDLLSLLMKKLQNWCVVLN